MELSDKTIGSLNSSLIFFSFTKDWTNSIKGRTEQMKFKEKNSLAENAESLC